MLDIIIDGRSQNEADEINIAISAFSTPRLMTKFLSEVLFQVQDKYFFPSRLDIRKVTPKKLFVVIHGEKGKANIKKEIKNVTYHNFRVLKTDEGWECNIIFDL
jgi:SHS2 domain-containing protein